MRLTIIISLFFLAGCWSGAELDTDADTDTDTVFTDPGVITTNDDDDENLNDFDSPSWEGVITDDTDADADAPTPPSGACPQDQFELQILGRVECWHRCLVGQHWGGSGCTGAPKVLDWWQARGACGVIGVGQYLQVLDGCSYGDGWECEECAVCGELEVWALEEDPVDDASAFALDPVGLLYPRDKTDRLAVRCAEVL